MNEIQLKKNIFSYYFSLILLTISSSLPHSVLTVLLLSKGMSLSKIMLIQAGYSLSIILSEYPSGLLADIFSKKNLFIISKFFLILMFVIVYFSNNFMLLVLGWFAYGISNALDSGTIDVKIINDIKKLNQQDKLVTFISNSNRFNFISLLIGSTVGSFLYFRVGLKIYVVGIILTIISILTIYLFYDETVSNAEQKAYFEQITFVAFFKKIILQGKEGIKELKNSPTLRMMIALTFIGQFFFQAHFQLWQALFLTKNVSKHDFYIYYIVFQLLSVLAYSVPIDARFKKHEISFFIGFVLLMDTSLFGVVNASFIYFISGYTLLVFIFTLFDYLSNYLFARDVSMSHISSLTSLKSTVGRIGSIISMLLSSFLLNQISVVNVVFINFVCAIGLSVFIMIMYLFRLRKENYNGRE